MSVRRGASCHHGSCYVRFGQVDAAWPEGWDERRSLVCISPVVGDTAPNAALQTLARLKTKRRGVPLGPVGDENAGARGGGSLGRGNRRSRLLAASATGGSGVSEATTGAEGEAAATWPFRSVAISWHWHDTAHYHDDAATSS
jgi:hypothetical protein